MAALSSSSFLYAGVFFGVLLAGFLAVCLIALIRDEAREDAFGDTPAGDWPQLPTDLKVRNHSEGK